MQAICGKEDARSYEWDEIYLMKQYAQQRSMPTDEEIEDAAKEFQNDTSTSFNQGMYSGFIFGAIAIRNGKIKPKQ